jgi:hypothetical protein
MSKKIDRAVHGPSWAEIILGIILSTTLGIVLGATLLIIKPVVVAKELPKEPDPKAIYYLEGTVDTSKARQAPAKRAAFLQGQSVTVTEEELNALAAPAAAPATPAKPGATPPPAAAPAEAVAAGAPNFRIRNGEFQLAVPVTINAADLGQKIIVQSRGGFVKQGDIFIYEPTSILVGSCPVERLPFVANYVKQKVLAAHPIPEDLAAAWAKVTNVTVEGNALKVAMQ